jgi:hypothetical protein
VAARLEDTVEVAVVMVAIVEAIAVVHLQEEVEGALAVVMVDTVNKGHPQIKSVISVTKKTTRFTGAGSDLIAIIVKKSLPMRQCSILWD